MHRVRYIHWLIEAVRQIPQVRVMALSLSGVQIFSQSSIGRSSRILTLLISFLIDFGVKRLPTARNPRSKPDERLLVDQYLPRGKYVHERIIYR